MKTVLQHLETIKYPKLKKFFMDNLDHRYSNEQTRFLGYVVMLAVDMKTKDKKWMQAIQYAIIKNKLQN